MSDHSAIEWTGATWNPWQGCRRKSEGCRFCYMFRDMARYGRDPKHIHRSADATFRAPLKWQREVESGKRTGQARMVFTCSWSDWFIGEADAWRDEAWEVIRRCPSLVFQILTKRPERMADHLPPFWGEIRDRCWLGASAEDQRNYDARRPFVDADLSPVMWWSMEPLLGPIDADLGGYRHRPAWVVVGGESGAKGDPVRPTHPDWARALRDQCIAAGVAFHFKQFGEWAPYDNRVHGFTDTPGGTTVLGGKPLVALVDRREGMQLTPGGKVHPGEHKTLVVRVGKKAAGRILDGRTWDEFPHPVAAESEARR